MMASKPKIKTIDQGWVARLRNISQMASSHVEVGLPARVGAQLVSPPPEDSGASGPEAPEGMGGRPAPAVLPSLADLGAFHEFGTVKMPARPWLTLGVAAAEPRELMRTATLDVMNGKRTAEQALERVGLGAQSAIQKTITKGIEPPLAASTIKAKGSKKQLIDTGRLRAAITYDVILGNLPKGQKKG